MRTFFPALAMLQHLIDPLTTPTQASTGATTLMMAVAAPMMTSQQKKQLHEVLVTFSRAYR